MHSLCWNCLLHAIWACSTVLARDIPMVGYSGPGLRLEAHLTQVKPGKLSPRMRPHPSDELPVKPPRYPQDKDYLPQEEHLDPRKLKQMIGKDFDSKFMSTVRPIESILRPNGTLEYDFNSRRIARTFPEELQEGTLAHLPSRRRKRLGIKGKRTRKKVVRFLAAYTYCPVHYQWKDLGVRFWPRWIREGSCYSGRSCSVPPGMSCRPQRSTTKTVLWWHCPGHKHCDWITIRYPIITDCACSC